MKGSETASFCERVANCSEIDAKLLGLRPDDVAEAANWLPGFLQSGTVPPLPVKDREPDEDQGDDSDLDDDDGNVNDNHVEDADAEDMDEAA